MSFVIFVLLINPLAPVLPTNVAHATPAGIILSIEREGDAADVDGVDVQMRCNAGSGGSWQDVGTTSGGGGLRIDPDTAFSALTTSSGTCGSGSTIDFLATLDGYVTHEIDGALSPSFSDPQTLNDWLDSYLPVNFTGSDALLFSHSITVTDSGSGTPITGASIDAGGVTCIASSTPGVYLCPVTFEEDGSTVSVSATGYTTGTIAIADRSSNGDSQSADSGTLTPSGGGGGGGGGASAPSAPTDLAATSETSTSVSLSWTDNDSSDPVTNHEVDYSIHNTDPSADSWTPIDTSSTSTSYEVTGLSPSTNYDFKVDTSNDIGASSFSDIVTQSTEGTPDLTNGLIGFWKMDEVASSTAYDSSGNGFDGSVNGTPNWTTGKYGNAISLDGSSNYITVPEGINDDISNDVTVSAWINPSGTSFDQEAASIVTNAYDGSAVKFAIWTDSDPATGDANPNKIAAGFFEDGQWYGVSESGDFPFGGWTHVAATYDGSTLKLYINGVLDNTATVNKSLPSSSQPWYIGHRWDNPDYISGAIDDVRVYNRALSEEEISDLHSGENQDLAAEWKFDESSGSTASDASGNGNTLSLEGGDPNWTSGIFGNAFTFDGSSTYFHEDSSFVETPTSNLTLCGWVKTSSASQQTILTMNRSGDSADNEGVFQVLPDGKLNFWDHEGGYGFDIDSDGTGDNHSSGTVSDGNWHLACFAKNGTSGTYYIDGNQVGTVSAAGNVSYGASDWTIGKDYRDGGNYFNGQLDDVRVYTSTLSSAYIADLYAQADLGGGGGGGASAPSAPTDLAATSETSTSVSLSWTDNDSSDPVTNHEVDYSIHNTDPSADSWTPIDTSSTSTSYEVTGLSPSTNYDFKVDTSNDIGASSFSDIVTQSTEGTPISSCADFESISSNLSGRYVLTTSLSCSGEGNDIMVGTHDSPFTGTFDGAGHTITVSISNGSTDYVGLFGEINGATISNLGVAGSISGDSYVGGLAGAAINSSISKIQSTATVSGGFVIGGILGDVETSSISDSYFDGAVTSSFSWAGGIVGSLQFSGSIIERSYSEGSVSGDYAGGLIGIGGNGASLSDDFSVAEVSGSVLGGLIGQTGGPLSVTDSYWDITRSGQSSCGSDGDYAGCLGVNSDGSQTDYFKNNTSVSPFTAPWDFDSVWQVTADYPTLRGFASLVNLSDGLVGYWTFDEATGDAVDYSGNGNTGVLEGGASRESGKFADSLSVNGSTGYVNVPSSTNIPTGNSDYTISAWIKPTLGDDTEGIVGWGSYGSGNAVNALRIATGACGSSDGLVNYWWGEDLVACAPGGVNIYDGSWHHVAAEFDGTTRKIFLDGTLIGSDTPTGHDVPSANNFTIGLTNGSEYYDGQIDDVRVYNRALTNPEITALAGSAGNQFGAYWKLDESSGGVAADSSGNGNPGTVYGEQNWTAGQLNNGFSFDGSTYIGTNYVMPDQDSTTSFTWSAWVNASSGNPDNAVILGWRTGSHWIKLTPTRFEYYDGSIPLTHNIPTGQWVLITVVKNGTNFTYYQNGTVIATATSGASVSGNNFYMGEDPGTPSDGFFTGDLDDVRVYNTALSAGEISRLYDEVIPPFGGSGSGTSDDPYVITTCHELEWMSNNLSAHYVLGSNVDCGATSISDPSADDYDDTLYNDGVGFIPVGATEDHPFTGTLSGADGEGGNYEIQNLYINNTDINNVGLFGYTSGATLQYLSFSGANVTGQGGVGVLVGVAAATNISASHIIGGTVAGTYDVGGLVGYFAGDQDGETDNTYGIAGDTSSAAITGTINYGDIGGLAGEVDYGFVSGSSVGDDGAITIDGNTNQESDVGGLVGYGLYIDISNSHANASVSGYWGVGGLIGEANNTTISNSYSQGSVLGGTSDNPVSWSGGFGGLSGYGDAYNVTTGSHSSDDVTVYAQNGYVEDIGGLAGSMCAEGGDCSLQNSYATGNVTVNAQASDDGGNVIENIAGLVGFISGQTDGDPMTASGNYAIGNVAVNVSTSGGEQEVGTIGGLVGDAETIHMENSFASGGMTVTAPSGVAPVYVGGFAGYGNQSSFANDFASGDMTVNVYDNSAQDIGGFMGELVQSSMTNDYSSGTMTFNSSNGGGYSGVGGLVGYYYNGGDSGDNVTNSFSTSPIVLSGVTGDNQGALIGNYSSDDSYGSLVNNFYYENVGNNDGYCVGSDGGQQVNITDGDDNPLCTGIDSGSTPVNYFYDSTHAPMHMNWDFTETWTSHTTMFPTLTGLYDPYSAGFSGGTGTEEDPYQITSCADFENINNHLSGYYILENDLSCGGEGNNITVGTADTPFAGTFDGNGHDIDINLSDTGDAFAGVALFPDTNGATISHLSVSGTIETIHSASALVGDAEGSTLDHDSSSVAITIDTNEDFYARVGGLVGEFNDGSMTNSFSTGSITATGTSISEAGGLIGEMDGTSTLFASYSSESIDAEGNVDVGVGGLVGSEHNGTEISQSYATGNIIATQYVGGLVGHVQSATIEDSYATGNVYGEAYLGGLVGNLIGISTLSRTYATGSVTGESENTDSEYGGGLIGYSSSDDSATINNSFSTGLVSDFAGGNTGGFIGNVGGDSLNGNAYDRISSGQTGCVSDNDLDGCSAFDTLGAPDSNYMRDNSTHAPLNNWDFSDTPVWDVYAGNYPKLHAVAADDPNILIVNSLADDGDGTCTELKCTFRDAVDTAPEGATIVFQDGLTGTITLTAESGIDAENDISIIGPGKDALTVDFNADSEQYIEFFGEGSSFVSGITFANSNDSALYQGGDNNMAMLTIADSAFVNGGTYATLYIDGGTLNVNHCVFTDNSSNGYDGGAIFDDSSRDLNMSDSTFTGNTAVGSYQGGAVAYEGDGNMTILNSTFSGNSAEDGGAIVFYYGDVFTLNDSTFSGNYSTHWVGAIDTEGYAAHMDGDTFSGNYAQTGGAGGALYNDSESLSITSSTFTNNTATANIMEGSGGGAINNDGLEATIINTTFYQNTTNGTDGVDGGAVYNGSGDMSFMNDTFDGDSADGDGSSGGEIFSGGGTVSVTNSILTGGSPTNCSGMGITSGGYNIDSGTSCEFNGTGDLSNTDPLLSTDGLADNGGPVETIALEDGSPAIDAGTSSGAPSTDAQGFSRPQLFGYDIGAFEYETEGFEGGSGTSDDPYLIGSCSAFELINANLSASYQLTRDLDCTRSGNNIIVGNFTDESAFLGSFDGDGHSIKVNINDPEIFGLGLFAITEGALIENLTIASGSSIVGDQGVGGLVGLSLGTTIQNVSVNATVTGNGAFPESEIPILGTGGLVGMSIESEIDGSSFNGTANGSALVGGLVGGGVIFETDSVGTISRSFATGTIKGAAYTGGLIGYLPFGSLTDSYFNGTVQEVVVDPDSIPFGNYSGSFGGLVGITGLGDENPTTIARDYSAGSVQAEVGDIYPSGGGIGIITDNGVTVSDSFSASAMSGDEALLGGFFGDTGETDSVLARNYYDIEASTLGAGLCIGMGDESGGGDASGQCEGIDTSGDDSDYFLGNTVNVPYKNTIDGVLQQVWNFDSIWLENDGEYPTLRAWDGDISAPDQVVFSSHVASKTDGEDTGQMELDWTEPNANGSDITDYLIQYKLHSDESWTTWEHDSSTSTSVTITGLTVGDEYDFAVSAINGVGTGEAGTLSAYIEFPPGSGTVSSGGVAYRSVTVDWTEPDDTGGAPIQSYMVLYRTHSDGDFESFGSIDGSARSLVVTGLTNGTAYDFEVKAYNDAANGIVGEVDDITPTVSGNTAKIKVTVTDTDGNPVAGANVQIQCESGSWDAFGETDEGGIVENYPDQVDENCTNGDAVSLRANKSGYLTLESDALTPFYFNIDPDNADTYHDDSTNHYSVSGLQTPLPGKWMSEFWNLPSPTSAPDFNSYTDGVNPDFVRNDDSINFDWGEGSPDLAVNDDGFLARFTKTQNLDAGNYTFTATSDDGVRVYVDDSMVIDGWFDQSATEYDSEPVSLSAGSHTIVVEYYENGGDATISFSMNGGGSGVSAPTVELGSPSNISTTGVTLNGVIDNDGGQNANVIGFDYGLTADYSSTVRIDIGDGGGGTGSYDRAITGLACGTTYHYRFYAANGSGIGYNVGDATFTTSNCPIVGGGGGGGGGGSGGGGNGGVGLVHSTVPTVLPSTHAVSVDPFCGITTDLAYGAAGASVKCLQDFLVAQNEGPSAKALAKNGTTIKFFMLTKNALMEFQNVFGLPKTGIVDSATRAFLAVYKGVSPVQTPAVQVSTVIPVFTRNLELWSVDPEVKLLQKFLNSHGFTVAQSGPGSAGHETTVFSQRTKNALIKFQEANFDAILKPQGFQNGTGVFSSYTRAFVNKIISQEQKS